jgi:hypothetical protein
VRGNPTFDGENQPATERAVGGRASDGRLEEGASPVEPRSPTAWADRIGFPIARDRDRVLRGLRTALRNNVQGLVPLVVLALWLPAIGDVDVGRMTDVGLVSVLPPAHFALLGVLTLSFGLALQRRDVRTVVPLFHVIVLAVMLYGVTGIVETEPRFAVSYRHAGIVDYIVRHREVDPGIDAYFNWPGFFALGALLEELVGVSALGLAPWTPLFFNLCSLLPLVAIFRWVNGDPRVTWLAAWIFLSANWVGQDYLAPQSLGFFLWLSLLALLMVAFGRRFSRLGVGRRRSPTTAGAHSGAAGGEQLGGRPALDIPFRLSVASQQGAAASFGPGVAILVLVIAGLFAAITTGHQLTPAPALLTVAALTVLGYLETRALAIVLALILLGWVSYMTTTYLSGHLDDLVASFGALGGNLERSVAHRVEGSPGHLLVVKARLVLTAALWLLALLGLVRRLRAGHRDAPLVVVGTIPLLLPALQGYGGEVVLRSFLFTLPAAAYFAATFAFPSRSQGWSRFTPIVTLAVTALLLAGFQYARYGNERADNFTRADVRAVEALYRLAPWGSTLVAGFENAPWKFREYETYPYRTLNRLSTWDNALNPRPSTIVEQLRRTYLLEGGYFIVTPAMRIAAEMYEGKGRALDGVAELLSRSPTTEVVYANQRSVIIRVASSLPAERPIPRDISIGAATG